MAQLEWRGNSGCQGFMAYLLGVLGCILGAQHTHLVREGLGQRGGGDLPQGRAVHAQNVTKIQCGKLAAYTLGMTSPFTPERSQNIG